MAETTIPIEETPSNGEQLPVAQEPIIEPPIIIPPIIETPIVTPIVAVEPPVAPPYLYHVASNSRYINTLGKRLPVNYQRVYKAMWASPNMTLEEIATATKMKPEDVNMILNHYQNEGIVKVAQKPIESEKILVINVPPETRYREEYTNIKGKEKEKSDSLHGYSRVSMS